jgi:Ion channel
MGAVREGNITSAGLSLPSHVNAHMSSVHELSCDAETVAPAMTTVPSFKETHSGCKRLLRRIQRFCSGETTASPLDDELMDADAKLDSSERQDSSVSTGRSLTAGFQKFASSNKALLLLRTQVLIYLALSIICFSFLFEDWSVIDSLYFATVLFTTIGYGDLLPTTDAGRICTMLLVSLSWVFFWTFAPRI